MAVIKEIKNESGGVIRIHDDYCKNNTPEDNQKIVDNVSRIINDYYIKFSEQRLASNTGNRLKYSRKILTGEIAKILDGM